MMHQPIFRSSIRRMRLVASKQKDVYRSLSSTSGTPNNDNNSKGSSSNSKDGTSITPVAFAAVDGNISSFSVGSGVDMSIGRSTTELKKAGVITSNFANASFVGKNTFSNNAGSNCNDEDGSSGPEFRSVYVHPLSQIVLEYLQESRHEWVVAKGLDQSLTLHRDGSFELKDVSQSLSSMSTAAPTPPLPSSVNKKDQPNTNCDMPTSAKDLMKNEKSKEKKSTLPTKDTSDSEINATGPSTSQQEKTSAASTTESNENIRIWTSYDEQEKKHWLTVRRGLFRQRFLLQNNLLTAWQGNRGVSLPERLQVAVDEMIRAVDRLDQQQAATIGQQQWQQKGQRRFRKR